jgi:hypothetical protein
LTRLFGLLVPKRKEDGMKKTLCAALAVIVAAGCSDADVASSNLSKAADNFEVTRRIVFYNGITGDYMLTIEGLCSLGNHDKAGQLSVTCKTAPAAYKKHFLGLSDNVTYFVEQVDAMPVGVYHYRVFFKPQAILPNIDFKGSLSGK